MPVNHFHIGTLLLTPSVAIFAYDGAGPRLLVVLQIVFAILTGIAGTVIFTVVLPIHDDWCCYAHDELADLKYGRCTHRRASIWTRPATERAPCDSKSYTHADIVMFCIAGVIAGVYLIVYGTRILIIFTELHRMSLPTHAELKQPSVRQLPLFGGVSKPNAAAHIVTWLHGAFEHASSILHRHLPKHNTHIFLIHRLRHVVLVDPVSYVFSYGSIVLGLPGWHVLFQMVMSGTAIGMLVVFFLADMSVLWRHWLVMCVGAFTAALSMIHHLYICARLYYYTTRGTQAVAAELHKIAHMHSTKSPSERFRILKDTESLIMSTIKH